MTPLLGALVSSLLTYSCQKKKKFKRDNSCPSLYTLCHIAFLFFFFTSGSREEKKQNETELQRSTLNHYRWFDIRFFNPTIAEIIKLGLSFSLSFYPQNNGRYCQGVEEFTKISWGTGGLWVSCRDDGMTSRCNDFKAVVSCANEGRKFGSLVKNC